MRILIVLLLLFISFDYSLADVNSNGGSGLLIQEEDGTNAGRYRVLIFPNGSTINNGDGSISVFFTPTPIPKNLTFLSVNLTFLGSQLTFTK